MARSNESVVTSEKSSDELMVSDGVYLAAESGLSQMLESESKLRLYLGRPVSRWTPLVEI